MHDMKVVIVTSGTAMIVQKLFFLDVDFVAILNTDNAIGVSIWIIGDITFVLSQLMHQVSNASIW